MKPSLKDKEFILLIKNLLWVFLLFSLSVYGVRQILIFAQQTKVLNYDFQSWSSKRSREMISILEKRDPSFNNKTIMFFGTSVALFAVNSRAIEDKLKAKGKNFEILNLSFLRFDADAEEALIHRISEMPIGRAKKLNTAIIQFEPSRHTKTFAKNQKQFPEANSLAAYFYSDKMLLDDFENEPSSAIKKILSLYLLDGVSPNEARNYLMNFFKKYFYDLGFPKEAYFSFTELNRTGWHFHTANVKGWDIDSHGHFSFEYSYVNPFIMDKIKEFKSPEIAEINNVYLNKIFDIKNFDMDPRLLELFIMNVKTMRQLFKNVEVLYIPLAPSSPTTPRGNINIERALEEIHESTGAKIINLSKKKIFNEDDYFDLHHLNRAGQQKVTDIMAPLIEGIK